MVNKLLTSNDVELYSTFNEEKSSIVERFNRTFLHWLFIYFDTHQNTVYLPVLQDLVTRYNHTRHRSIGCTPEEARKRKNYQRVFDHLYLKRQSEPIKPPIFRIGDQVRLSVIKTNFEKGYTRNWTEELFVIDGIKKTRPVTYTIEDLKGKKFRARFIRSNYNDQSKRFFK